MKHVAPTAVAALFLWAVVFFAGLGLPATAVPAEGPAILMFHGDPGRTGWMQDEHRLTPAALRTGRFGTLWVSPVDGEIYAEPLVVSGVAVLGRVRTVVYVVTERDLIYAFDAADGGRLWGPVSLGSPVPGALLPCGDIDPVGITSTPVLDRGAGTLYVVGLTTPDGGRAKTYLAAALDLKSGVARPGWPVPIAPPPSSGFTFHGGVEQQRGALLLTRGVVYVPFGGYRGGCGDYHGWIVAVPVPSPRRQQSFATPAGRQGGIWAAGGIAADLSGNLYAATGAATAGPADLSDSVIRLATSPTLRFSGASRDFFTPSNVTALNGTGVGLGASAPLVVPDQPDLPTPHLVFIAGKQGIAYLVNRDNMGGVSRGTAIGREGVFSRCAFGTCERNVPEVFSAAAYWDGGSAGRVILVPGRGRQPAPCVGTGGIAALRLGTAAGSRAPRLDVAWCSASMRDPGAPSVSGIGPDGGVVWVLDTGEDAVLYGLDARTGDTLFKSAAQNAVGRTERFVTPAVVGGRVYIGAGDRVVAYGLR
ncbi:MAG TPA: hypothetical protein VKZ50_07150 [bacterium]|nr:hypothetical protein [bacterium]